ncbi:hypothetical protein GCM10009801_19240 [Streptomyces albiaxialis]|uniref:FhaA N-terminal domain-containing protein n=1 Tax=Streptomyces albiaxialis TaxID=329523 RepID=A0ABP5H9I1_9ACTN
MAVVRKGSTTWLGAVRERSTAWVRAAARRPRHAHIAVVTVLRHECDRRALIVSRDRVLVPNDFTIELPDANHERLAEYGPVPSPELAAQVRGYAVERRYSFAGPVSVLLSALPVGEGERFRVHSRVRPVDLSVAREALDPARTPGAQKRSP